MFMAQDVFGMIQPGVRKPAGARHGIGGENRGGLTLVDHIEIGVDGRPEAGQVSDGLAVRILLGFKGVAPGAQTRQKTRLLCTLNAAGGQRGKGLAFLQHLRPTNFGTEVRPGNPRPDGRGHLRASR